MATPTLEERVAASETRLEQIEHRREQGKSDETIPWWKRIVGIYQDSPDFDEMVRFGREWREFEDPADEGRPE